MHVPAGFFILRTPLYPFDVRPAAEACTGAAGGADVAAENERLRAEMRVKVERPEVREALLLASPGLVGSLERWLSDPASREGRRIEQSLVRYLSRMSGRTVPFGLFAGVSLGSVAERTHLNLGARSSYRRTNQIDFRYLENVLQELREVSKVRDQLRYRSNPTLYRKGNRLRFIARRSGSEGEEGYVISSVRALPAIRHILEQAVTPATMTVLLDRLGDDEAESVGCAGLLSALVEGGVLLDDLQPSLTGSTALPRAFETLPDELPAVTKLRTVVAMLQSEGATRLGLPDDFYRSLSRLESSSPLTVVPIAAGLLKPAPGLSLGRNVAAAAMEAVHLLHFAGGCPGEDPELAAFRSSFASRYGEGRSVPLLEALDPDFGVGFGNRRRVPEEAAIIEGLGLASAGAGEQPPFGRRDIHLLHLLEKAWTAGAMEIELDEADLRNLTAEPPLPLPDAFGILCAIEAKSSADVDDGEFSIVLKMAFGPSGGAILGSPANLDEEIRDRVRAFLRAEERLRPECIFAEVVHLPDTVAGNIVFRPVLRDYEIPLFGAAGGPADRKLELADLLVTLRHDSIRLHSKSLGQEIIPRLTCAHNYKLSHLDLYRFLGSLQLQGVQGFLDWSWGAMSQAAFLPRVRRGRAVLSRARWRANLERSVAEPTAAHSDPLRWFMVWKRSVRLPRFVSQVEGDQELPVDTENPLQLEAMLTRAIRRGELVLEEMLPAPDLSPARDGDGRFVHEIALPFVRESSKTASADTGPGEREGSNRFHPGSEWTYLKLYTPECAMDPLLSKIVGPFVAELKGMSLADKWHFLRYDDPEPHIRLRIRSKGSATALAERVEGLIEAVSGSCWRVQLDTYDRELERYGGSSAIDIVETMFDADSDAVVAILALLNGGPPQIARNRWKLAAWGVDRLLSDFGYTLEQRRELCGSARTVFRTEFGVTGEQLREIGRRYRPHRSELERIVRAAADTTVEFEEQAYRYRSHGVRQAVTLVRDLERRHILSTSIEEIALSLVHMHINRVLPALQREQELVIHEFLCRTYESLLARGRRRPQ